MKRILIFVLLLISNSTHKIEKLDAPIKRNVIVQETLLLKLPKEPETLLLQENSVISSEIGEEESNTEEDDVSEVVEDNLSYLWQGETLNRVNGLVEGPNGKETYYNLPMEGVIEIMNSLGFNYEYWVREDGVKMFGEYVMCAANLEIRPRGTILQTTLGAAIVCDTGTFAAKEPLQIDIAVDWK